jgi:hypothetical protein
VDSFDGRLTRQPVRDKQRFSFSVLCFLCFLLFKNSCVKRYMAKKEEMPVMEQKPGRY